MLSEIFRSVTGVVLTLLILSALPSIALCQEVLYYLDLDAGAYGLTGGGGVWGAIEDLYDGYGGHRFDDFDVAEDFIGPQVMARGGIVLFGGLDLSASVGWYGAEVDLSKRYHYGPYHSRRFGDEWDLDIVPVSASVGWLIAPWSVVSPYVGGGADLYVWDLSGKIESFDAPWQEGYFNEDFSSDGADFGWHVVAGLDVSDPNWWLAGILEARYTSVETDISGDMADFLDKTDLDLSGWSVLAGVRIRSPHTGGYVAPRSPRGPAPGPPRGPGGPTRLMSNLPKAK